MSLIEAITNVAVGYLIALLTQIIVFPLFGLQVSLGEDLAIGGLFTLTSIARSYILRRAFETVRMRGAETRTAGPRGAAASAALIRREVDFSSSRHSAIR